MISFILGVVCGALLYKYRGQIKAKFNALLDSTVR